MPQTALTAPNAKQPGLQSYSALIRQIRQTLEAGKQRAQQAVERELVRTKWETGKLIVEHILLNKNREGYGEQVLKRLSKDLQISGTELKYMVEFAQTYPIGRSTGQLSWAQIESLLAVNEDAARQTLSRRVIREKMTLKQTRHEIKKLKTAKKITVAKAPAPPKLPDIRPGELGLYAIFESNGKKYRDLGFSIWQEVKGLRPTKYQESDLYTYEAQVTHVFDGDTFHALIHLQGDLYLEQRLRLRRLDAPELITAEGQQAKKVLQRILFSSPVLSGLSADDLVAGGGQEGEGRILLKVSKADDQYGRYLVDVFIPIVILSRPGTPGTAILKDCFAEDLRATGLSSPQTNLLSSPHADPLSSPKSSIGDPPNYTSIDPQLLASGLFDVRG